MSPKKIMLNFDHNTLLLKLLNIEKLQKASDGLEYSTPILSIKIRYILALALVNNTSINHQLLTINKRQNRTVSYNSKKRYIFMTLLICIVFSWILTACTISPQVLSEQRTFLNLSLDFIDSYALPKDNFRNTTIGGLSAITYNPKQDHYYVLSDDRSNHGDARFYTLKLNIKQQDNNQIKITNATIENVTFLLDEQGNRYDPNSIDPEGIALSPRETVFISSEGNPNQNIAPFIGEFDLKTGKKKLDISLPQKYFNKDNASQGIQENLGFESLTLNSNSLAKDDPFRLFSATESALTQDINSDSETKAKIRLLHYVINPIGSPILVAEHLYLLDSSAPETISNGLTELLSLKKEGYFLSLERTFGFTGVGAKIYQVVVGNATDTSRMINFEDISNIQPLKKKLLLNLTDLGIYLDNVEGMCMGSRLPDGSRSLILVSDDNFNDEQDTQILLFRIRDNFDS